MELMLLLAEQGGVLESRGRRGLRGSISRAHRAGQVHRLLSGVHCAGGVQQQIAVRARAACRWDPDAVVLGEAAAALSFWPELRPAVV